MVSARNVICRVSRDRAGAHHSRGQRAHVRGRPRGGTQLFSRESIPFPKDQIFEWTGLDVLPGNGLAVATRWGEIWLVNGAFEADVSKVKYTLFATGLHEPLSVSWRDGSLYVTERAGITRLRDTNGDDRSDEAEVVTAAWGFSGDSDLPSVPLQIRRVISGAYHACPRRSTAGLPCAVGRYAPHLRAACTRRRGNSLPRRRGFQSGRAVLLHGQPWFLGGQFRAPAPSSRFVSRRRACAGVVESRRKRLWSEARSAFDGKALGRSQSGSPYILPPSVIFPHQRLVPSPTGFNFDKSGRFGLFAGQFIVGEHNGSRFVSGCSRRGWGSRAPIPFQLERLGWTGRMPFEVQTMQVWAKEFDVTFTEEVDRTTAASTDSYAVEASTYLQSTRMREYGSPKLETLRPRVISTEVVSDGRGVRLTIEPMTPGQVHVLPLPGLRNKAGNPVLHPIGWYTHNALPKTTRVFSSPGKAARSE